MSQLSESESRRLRAEAEHERLLRELEALRHAWRHLRTVVTEARLATGGRGGSRAMTATGTSGWEQWKDDGRVNHLRVTLTDRDAKRMDPAQLAMLEDAGTLIELAFVEVTPERRAELLDDLSAPHGRYATVLGGWTGKRKRAKHGGRHDR